MPVSIAGTESNSKERDGEKGMHERAEDRKRQELKSPWNHFRINVKLFLSGPVYYKWRNS